MVRTELHIHMPLQETKLDISFESSQLVVFSLPPDMSSVIGNHRFADGFVLPVERKFKKFLFNSLITGRSFENLSYLLSYFLSQR